MIVNYVPVFIFVAIYSLSGMFLMYLMYRLISNPFIIYEIIPSFSFAVVCFFGSGILAVKRLDVIVQKRLKRESHGG